MHAYTCTQHEERDNQIELEGLKTWAVYTVVKVHLYFIVFIEQFFILLMQCSMTTLELKVGT